jgi:phage-related protein
MAPDSTVPPEPERSSGPAATLVLEVFQKKTRTTPKQTVEIAKKRLRTYRRATAED